MKKRNQRKSKKLERTRERKKAGPHLKRSGPGDVVRQATTTPAVVLCSLLSFYFIHSFFLHSTRKTFSSTQTKKKRKTKQKKNPKKMKSRREREREKGRGRFGCCYARRCN